MKNITLAIDDKILQDARKYAARRNTTVNAIVRDHLTRLAAEDDRAAQARKRLIELAQNSKAVIGSWSREELYDRHG